MEQHPTCRFARLKRSGFATASGSIQKLNHRKPSGDIFIAQSGNLLGESVGGDDDPRIVRASRRLRREFAGVRRLRPLAAHRRSIIPLPLIDEALVDQARRPRRPTVSLAVGHGSLSRDGVAKTFAFGALTAAGARRRLPFCGAKSRFSPSGARKRGKVARR